MSPHVLARKGGTVERVFQHPAIANMDQRKFDVIVVGAGSAGCVVAGHPCQVASLSVCLVEAGPDYGPLIGGRWPPELLNPRDDPVTHDWGYYIDQVGTPSFISTRAKVVGGCSAHHDCAAIWGLPEDYDAWAEAGNPGWGYADIRPLIDRIERVSAESDSPFRGHNGALPACRFAQDELAIFQRWFVDACLAAGFPEVDDLSAVEPAVGFGLYHANIRDSMRFNAAFAFLDPVRELSNLTILSETITDRLVFEDNKATGLVCRAQGETLMLTADTYVLSAGAYGPPAILMRSGIGSADHLRRLEIPVNVDLPGVGRNLHDHTGFYIDYAPTPAVRREIQEELVRDNPYRGQIILKAKSSYCKAEFDLHLLPVQELDSSANEIFRVGAYSMTPLSQGQVSLRGKDPSMPPRIEARYT